MISFPFDGQVETTKELTAKDKKTVTVPSLDRGYSSADLQKVFSQLYTDGIAQNIPNCFHVTVGTGMQVIVNGGYCMTGGAMGFEESSRTLTVKASNPTLDRIDAVVARKDSNLNYRNIDLYVVQGTPSQTPQPPAPTRTKEIHEIVLAHVFVAKGTTSISDYRITDTRFNTNLCGLMQPRPNVDTTGIFKQYQDALDQFLETVKNALDGTLAGNLQNKINELEKKQTDFEKNFSVTGESEQGGWIVRKYPNNFCELYIKQSTYRASKEATVTDLKFPTGIKLKKVRVQMTPALNGWNVVNFYNNTASQDNDTVALDKITTVFYAKDTTAQTYNFDIIVSGFLA